MVFASCSKNDQPEQREAAIAFSSYTGRAISKADAGSFIGKGSTALLDNSKFAVYAYATGADAFDGTNTSNVFMNNVEVTYAGGGADVETNYTYSPLRYWPNDEANNKLSFFATYPYGGTGISGSGFGAYTFTAQTDPAAMVDFIVSEVAPDQVYSRTNSGKKGVVKMKFHHALSMVKFKVNTDADYATDGTVITLKSIKVAAVNTVGTVTPTFASGATTFAWSAQGTPAEFTVFSGSQALDETAVTVPTGTEADDAYLMVPQELSDNVKVTVVYTVKTDSDAEIENTAEIVLNTALDSSKNPITAWNMNQNTVYTFTVGLKPIQFIAQVLDWDAETVSGITIPAE